MVTCPQGSFVFVKEFGYIWVQKHWGFSILRNPLAASQWHLWGLVFGLNVAILPGFLFLFHGCQPLEYQWRPASGICRVQNPKLSKNQSLSLFQLYINGRRPVGRAFHMSRRGMRDRSCFFCLFGTTVIAMLMILLLRRYHGFGAWSLF